LKCGAPDFIITRKKTPLGHVETKDIGTNLDEMERGRGPNGEQFVRYRDGLANWILTDYLQFRWIVNGEKRLTVRAAELDAQGKLKTLPDGEENLARLLAAFFEQEALTVGTAKELAQRMAGMTRIVRDLIVNAFEHEKEAGWLHNWLAAFRETLIPELDEKQFADMFAQTLAYGLFAARVHAPPNKPFSREMAAYNLPKTNPFLRKLFAEIAGVDMPDAIAWAVDDVVELLKHADMAEILTDFGKDKGKEDPVVHFYETFLAAYDPKMREVRGVYYTPEPVVSYIVRSIDHLLKTRFNRPKGLADENTLILDPATGTATFLYFVIDQIHRKFAKQAGAWDDYVAKHLLNRVFGFELLMAPYAVAHLKLGMQLQETGYKFGSDQRLGIYLTNTLEEAVKKSEHIFAGWVADEANAAARIKRDEPILVVLGNPPYSGVSANRGDWITNLVADYRKVDGQPLGEKKVWLKNDYIKFIRFGQWRIQRTGHGILAFITDHSYLDSPTFRGMRQNLLATFDEIFILNLHGNSKRRETAPDGGVDENVFDITQGVAIALFVKFPKKGDKGVYSADVWGERAAKYETLSESDVGTTKWRQLAPAAPFYEFVPVKRRSQKEYREGWRVTDIFPVGSNGVQTSRDDLVVDSQRDTILKRIEHFLDPNLSDAAVRAAFFRAKSVGNYPPGDTRGWKLGEARQALRNVRQWRQAVTQYLYRPCDVRFLLYHNSMVDWPRPDVMRHLQQPNLALCVGRAGLVTSGPWDLIFCTRQICDHNLFYRGSSLNCPLYLYPNGETPRSLFDHENSRRPNLSANFVDELSERLAIAFVPDGPGDLRKTIGPEDVFHYAYAVFHSPTYRTRYAEFLKIDFPRLPLTADIDLFRALAAKGADLVALHLMESPTLADFVTEFPQKGDNAVEKIRYTENDHRVWINPTQYFQGVPKECWEFHIGGYQVCEKWLKDRKGRKLGYEEIEHYQKIVVSLKQTIRLMKEIDVCIPGWPLA
jgi:predicted helicase